MIREEVLKEWSDLKVKFKTTRNDLAKEKGWWYKWFRDERIGVISVYSDQFNLHGGDLKASKSWTNKGSFEDKFTTRQIKKFFKQNIYQYYIDKYK
jgi:hypothetical protein